MVVAQLLNLCIRTGNALLERIKKRVCLAALVYGAEGGGELGFAAAQLLQEGGMRQRLLLNVRRVAIWAKRNA